MLKKIYTTCGDYKSIPSDRYKACKPAIKPDKQLKESANIHTKMKKQIHKKINRNFGGGVLQLRRKITVYSTLAVVMLLRSFQYPQEGPRLDSQTSLVL